MTQLHEQESRPKDFACRVLTRSSLQDLGGVCNDSAKGAVSNAGAQREAPSTAHTPASLQHHRKYLNTPCCKKMPEGGNCLGLGSAKSRNRSSVISYNLGSNNKGQIRDCNPRGKVRGLGLKSQVDGLH
jgi:hypothetical protein